MTTNEAKKTAVYDTLQADAVYSTMWADAVSAYKNNQGLYKLYKYVLESEDGTWGPINIQIWINLDPERGSWAVVTVDDKELANYIQDCLNPDFFTGAKA